MIYFNISQYLLIKVCFNTRRGQTLSQNWLMAGAIEFCRSNTRTWKLKLSDDCPNASLDQFWDWFLLVKNDPRVQTGTGNHWYCYHIFLLLILLAFEFVLTVCKLLPLLNVTFIVLSKCGIFILFCFNDLKLYTNKYV